MKMKREDKKKADKRERDADTETEGKAARNQGMTDVSSPVTSSSHQAAVSSPTASHQLAVPAPTGPSVATLGERTLEVTWNDDEAPDKVQTS